MSSVGGIGSSFPSNFQPAALRGQSAGTDIQQKIQGKLNEKLESAGVSDSEREALQADLTAAFQTQFGGGDRPEPGAFRETISSVFESHGLDAEEFLPKGPPSGGVRGGFGARGGFPPQGAFAAQGSEETQEGVIESLQSLIESLQEGSESDDGSTSEADVSQISEKVLDILLGLDVTA